MIEIFNPCISSYHSDSYTLALLLFFSKFFFFPPQYYESLLAEAKSKRESLIPETVEKAVASKMQDIQNELEICEEAKKAVADVNPLTTHFRSVILFFFGGVVLFNAFD